MEIPRFLLWGFWLFLCMGRLQDKLIIAIIKTSNLINLEKAIIKYEKNKEDVFIRPGFNFGFHF